MPSPPFDAELSGRAARNLSRVEYDKMVDAGMLHEDKRVELIGGTVVQMSPEGAQHAGTIDLVAEALRTAFGARHTVRVQHPLIFDPDDEPAPDLAVVRGGPRDHLTRHPSDPLLVVEVSESSLAFDRADKARLYARAGVQEYWIVNLIERRIEVHRRPTPAGYAAVESLGPGAKVSPLAAAGASIEIAALLP